MENQELLVCCKCHKDSKIVLVLFLVYKLTDFCSFEMSEEISKIIYPKFAKTKAMNKINYMKKMQ